MISAGVRSWVIDASVVVKLLVEEEDSGRAAPLGLDRLLAPDLIATECANTLWKHHRRGLLTPAAVLHRLGMLPALLGGTMPAASLLTGALTRAMRLAHPVYDCLYLEAAAQTGLPLVTADRRLAALAGDGAEVVLLSDLPPA